MSFKDIHSNSLSIRRVYMKLSWFPSLKHFSWRMHKNVLIFPVQRIIFSLVIIFALGQNKISLRIPAPARKKIVVCHSPADLNTVGLKTFLHKVNSISLVVKYTYSMTLLVLNSSSHCKFEDLKSLVCLCICLYVCYKYLHRNWMLSQYLSIL